MFATKARSTWVCPHVELTEFFSKVRQVLRALSNCRRVLSVAFDFSLLVALSVIGKSTHVSLPFQKGARRWFRKTFSFFFFRFSFHCDLSVAKDLNGFSLDILLKCLLVVLRPTTWFDFNSFWFLGHRRRCQRLWYTTLQLSCQWSADEPRNFATLNFRRGSRANFKSN